MKQNLTELVFIVDRSGSMGGLESDTIGGFNATLDKHRTAEGEAVVSTVLFDNETKVLHDRIPIAKVPAMTERDYQVRGCTALLDAVGGAIRHITRVHGYLPEEYRPEHTIFVITTDGYENASRRYDYATVKRMIEEKKETGWEFLFLGANIDAVETAARYGISEDRAVTYRSDHEGQALNFQVMGDAVECLRSSAPLGREWKERIEEDVRKRGR